MTHSNKLLHWATRQWANRYRANFIENSNQLKATQSHILNNLLKQTCDAPAHAGYGLSLLDNWKTFAEKVPLTDYEHWQPSIQKPLTNQPGRLCNSPIQRYQPTSGSTSTIKWIPYSKQFLSEINAALMPWVAELYRTNPGIWQGFHYWSVSWIPSTLRDQVDDNVNDDLTLLPWWERLIAARYFAVPESVARSQSSEDTMFATLAWLVARRNLSFLSIWSPTFAITLIKLLDVHREELVEVLSRGEWLSRAKSLHITPCPKDRDRAMILRQTHNVTDPCFLAELWPHLSLISCWDTACSKIWAEKLHEMFPYAQMEGKGLWATEGVVTIPFSGKYPLALNSHYYEFFEFESNTTIPCWKLEKGMNVSPILTTGSGFLRYKLNDRLVVTDFYNQVPCLKFLSRMSGTDMAGEKLSNETAQAILDQFKEKHKLNPISLLAIPGYLHKNSSKMFPGCYVLLCEAVNRNYDIKSNSEILEQYLSKHFHYKLARELNQLSPASVITSDKASEIYYFLCKQRGMSEGNIKIEPLVFWDVRLHPTLTSSLYHHHINNTDYDISESK
jgi:hypothetical protein